MRLMAGTEWRWNDHFKTDIGLFEIETGELFLPAWQRCREAVLKVCVASCVDFSFVTGFRSLPDDDAASAAAHRGGVQIAAAFGFLESPFRALA